MVLDLAHKSGLDTIVGSFLQYYLLERASVSGREVPRDVISIRDQMLLFSTTDGIYWKEFSLGEGW